MNKRILSILLCLLLVASLLVLAVPAGAAPTERMQLKVVADKESAKAGDTVAFQIVMGPVTDVGSIQMTVDIPAGLTYVTESGAIVDGVKDAMGFDNIGWEDTSLVLNGYASSADYVSTEDTVLATFECTVDEEAAGTLSVGLTEIEMGSCETFEVFSDLFDVVTADVAIEGETPEQPTEGPTDEPSEEPTEEPAACEHELTHVDEVPATTEADGIKAHYVCEKCGKLFEDAFGTVELTEADLVIPKIVEDPTEAPEDPTEAPEDPTTAPEDPTTAPEEPTTAPEEPTTVPEEPTEAPIVEPTDAPEDQPTVAPTEAATQAPATKDTATKDTATKDTATKDSSSTSSPKTGDSTNMYLWMLIMLVSMVGAGAVLYTAKRKGIFTK